MICSVCKKKIDVNEQGGILALHRYYCGTECFTKLCQNLTGCPTDDPRSS